MKLLAITAIVLISLFLNAINCNSSNIDRFPKGDLNLDFPSLLNKMVCRNISSLSINIFLLNYQMNI